MPLSLAELESIQADALADDIPIDFAKMSLWTSEQATTFFESGGTEEPTSEKPAPVEVSEEPAPAPSPTPLGRKPRVAVD